MNVIETSGLGRRYGSTWALRDCTLAHPRGSRGRLVGPNGAGKTTLLNLVVGLTAPTAGGVTVLGGRPAGSPAALDGIAFVAQDMPLYRHLSVADMLHLTRNLNLHFDRHYARRRLAELGIGGEAEDRQAVRWSAGAARAHPGAGAASAAAGSRRADRAARPARAARLHGHRADRDGRRRRLGAAVLARVGRIRAGGGLPHPAVAGPGAGGRRGRRPARQPPHADRPGRRGGQIRRTPGTCDLRRGEAQAHLLVRATADDPVPPRWEAHPVGLEELALAYLREPDAAALPGPARGRDAEPSEVTQ